MSTDFPTIFHEFESCVRAVCTDSQKAYPLHEPVIGEPEIAKVIEALQTGWVSTVGPHVDAFEKMLSEITGSPYVVATVNGTTALHLALIVAGVKPGDEVLVPPLSFAATVNAVAHAGAINHFVEVEQDTLGIDPKLLRSYLSTIGKKSGDEFVNKRSGKRIAAIIPVHIFGLPCQIDEIKKVADEFGIATVEDAAEALGSYVDTRHCGTIAQIGTLSFNGNKIVTTGGGGAILTSDPEIAKQAKHLSTTARVPHPWRYWHDEVGYNYRLPNLNAAMGCAQLASLKDFLKIKADVANRYAKKFEGFSEATLLAPKSNTTWNHWLISVRLSGKLENRYEELLDFLHTRKILARPLWSPLHTLPMYKDCPRAELKCAEYLASNIICLPSSATLKAV